MAHVVLCPSAVSESKLGSWLVMWKLACGNKPLLCTGHHMSIRWKGFLIPTEKRWIQTGELYPETSSSPFRAYVISLSMRFTFMIDKLLNQILLF